MRAWVLIGMWGCREQYWTGEVKATGFPRTSCHTDQAACFPSPRDAYDCAQEYIRGQSGEFAHWPPCPRLARFKVGLREIVYRMREAA